MKIKLMEDIKGDNGQILKKGSIGNILYTIPEADTPMFVASFDYPIKDSEWAVLPKQYKVEL